MYRSRMQLRSASERLRCSVAWQRLRAELIGEDSSCANCGSRSELEADHVVPLSVDFSRGLDPSNVRVLCRSCNVSRNRAPLSIDVTDVAVRREW